MNRKFCNKVFGRLNDNRDNGYDNDYGHIDGIMSKIYCRFSVMEKQLNKCSF